MHDRIVYLERLVMSLIPVSARASPPGSVAATPSQGLLAASDPGPTLRPGPGPHSVPAPASGAKPEPVADPISASATMITRTEAAPSAAEPNPPIDVESDCGSMRMSPSELRYVGGDHWAAILESIANLKDHFDREERFRLAQDEQDTLGGGAEANDVLRHRRRHTLLLYGCPLPASRAEILAALPPRSAVDRYVSRYFNRLDLVHCIVHGPSFLREYETFWTNPSSVPIIWVGLLFSMICLALLASDPLDTAHGDPEHRSLQVDLYREKTVQCLLLGEYTKSGPYVLETVVHYIYIELNLRGDADKDIWLLFALEVNLAMRMGYHRDPSHFPGISPLQSEMRRRLWAIVLQGDILVSTQMGMPRMISDWKWDTAEPRNLSDADLDENTAELPPPRPETELTPALGIIGRRRMYIALGAICDVTAAVQPCSYAEIMRVDGILHQAAANIPAPLKPKPMAISITDAPEVIMARLFIAHLFYKGQIMLHRRFLYLESPSRDKDMFAYSRTTCLEASLAALELRNILDEETRPGGELYMMRWRVSSVLNDTFLTATMVLCSLLHRGLTLHRDDEILSALRRARTIWMRASSSSHEAKRAAETVSIVLARAGEGRSSIQDQQNMNKTKHSEQECETDAAGLQPGSEGADPELEAPLQDDLTTLGIGAFDPDRFVMPGLLGGFTPPHALGNTISFSASPGMDSLDVPLDEWVNMTDGSGTNW
ncbi:fungal-specific transcription factor [Achaetomium macrosporum]|uniref:Fungal-specific transcription factor n=1 Tax=Achaetomium macrosporum TaxID=79813 RepID=A0AAN7C3K5_9PEZI|nr:fungal-specific transcription factor [Achaetomium macrosporum]